MVWFADLFLLSAVMAARCLSVRVFYPPLQHTFNVYLSFSRRHAKQQINVKPID